MSTTLHQRRPLPTAPDLSTPPNTSDTSPAVPASVIRNLVGFTAAMITAPLSSYFLVLKTSGSATWAGALAAVVANVVLVGYIIVAYNEDVAERGGEGEKKGQ